MAHDMALSMLNMAQNMKNLAQDMANMAQNMKDMSQGMAQVASKLPEPPVGILNLPPELLDLVLSFSTSSDWTSLRLTCKHIYTHTLDTFARRFLHTLKTNISEADLPRLECLAENASLAPYVRSLQIEHRPAEYDKPKYAKYIRHPEGSIEFEVEKPYAARLGDILRSFTNCSSFHFDGLIQNEKEPPSAEGDMTLLLNIMDIIERPVTEVTFQCLFRGRDYNIRYRSCLEALLLAPLRNRLSGTVWEHVQHTSIGFASVNDPAQRHIFIDHAMNPRSLTLDAQLSVVGQTLMNHMLSATPQLPLERLRICRSQLMADYPVYPYELRIFLSRYSQTLEELEIYWVAVEMDGWIATLNFLAAAEFPRLKYVLFQCLIEGTSINWRTVVFPALLESPTLDGFPEEKIVVERYHFPADSVSYRGPNMDIALRKIANSARYMHFRG